MNEFKLGDNVFFDKDDHSLNGKVYTGVIVKQLNDNDNFMVYSRYYDKTYICHKRNLVIVRKINKYKSIW